MADTIVINPAAAQAGIGTLLLMGILTICSSL